MKVTLTSSAVAYSLLTLARAVLKNANASPHELVILIPDQNSEAANAGAIVKVGGPDSLTTPTDVTNPEWRGNEGDSNRWSPPMASVNFANMYAKASVNNCVLDISIQG